MTLPVHPPVAPMLAKLSRELPRDDGLFYEPKWDGFRCIVFRDGDDVELGSRNEKPLTRYFPELIDPLKRDLPDQCVLDGEIVIAGPSGLDFDALSQRIHPAESRVRKLAADGQLIHIQAALVVKAVHFLNPGTFPMRNGVTLLISQDPPDGDKRPPPRVRFVIQKLWSREREERVRNYYLSTGRAPDGTGDSSDDGSRFQINFGLLHAGV